MPLSDEAVICTWMEPDPRTATEVKVDLLRWWGARWRGGPAWTSPLSPGDWEFTPRLLTLDALREVETRLTDQQVGQYDANLRLAVRKDPVKPWVAAKCHEWHCSAETKIAALASVLRSEVEK